MTTRLIGSTLFNFFQIGRMAIVMFLSALALAAITPFSEAECILIMGILSIIYCTLGGVEAVIWTDTIQTFVLLGGAFVSMALIVSRIDGGVGTFMATAMDERMGRIIWVVAVLDVSSVKKVRVVQIPEIMKILLVPSSILKFDPIKVDNPEA